MRVRKHRELKVNMGEYESFDFGADVTMSNHDFGYTDDTWAALTEDERNDIAEVMLKELDIMLSDLMVQEVKDATYLTNYQRSFILNGLQPPAEKPRSQPAAEKTAQKPRRRTRSGS